MVRALRFVISAAALALALFALAACQSGDREEGADATADEGASEHQPEPAPAATPEGPGAASGPARQSVAVKGIEYAFQGPDTMPAGWTTFEFRNAGQQHHFLLVYRLPDGKTRADVIEELVPVYDKVMLALQEGKVDKQGALEMLGQNLPEWGFTLDFRGGPGLVAPGGSTLATVNLEEPGLYMMECYVKGPEGRFHSSMGMSRQFTVTEPASEAVEPEADTELTLSNAGIEAPESLPAGEHTFQVNFEENPPGGFPYDVHLARLSESTDVAALRAWMDWMNVGGLRAPAPAHFVGGAENMAAGNTAYFTVDLKPGRYALLSEVGATGSMYRELTVE